MTQYPMRPLREAIFEDPTMVQLTPSETYAVTGIYSFGRGLIRRPKIRGDETSYQRMSKLKTGQVIMSKLNAWEGALAVVDQSFNDTYASPEYPVFSIDTQVAHPSYIKHLLAWPELWINLTPRGSMVRRKRTTPSALLATKVPLPDREEQRRIADKLDIALTHLNKVELLRAQISQLRLNLHESLISSALDSGTKPVRMGDVVKLTRTEIEIDPNELYSAIGMRSFGNGIIHYPPTPGGELGKLRFFKFPANALALSNIKAWEGAINVTSQDEAEYIASNRFLFYLPVDERVNTSYLRYYLLSRPGLAQVSACSPGAADRNRTLGVKRFEGIDFQLPSREVQDRVASALDALSARLSKAHAMPALSALRPSILNAAFSGQL